MKRPGPKAKEVTASNFKDQWREIGLWDLYEKDLRCRNDSHFPYSSSHAFAKEYYPDSCIKDKFIEYINCYKGNKHRCCILGILGPHEPHDASICYLENHNNHPISQPRML